MCLSEIYSRSKHILSAVVKETSVKPNHSYLIAQPSRSSLFAWMLVCLIVALALVLLIIQPALAQKKLTATEAKDHVGETVTVCGNVVSTRYASTTKGQPTFLNLDKPYPNQIFTVVIWGSNRSKFGAPESEYKGKRICVTGKITEYRNVPQIIAERPQQIQMN